jgi:hypothetical protein
MLFTQYLHNFKTGSRMFVASVILRVYFTQPGAQTTVKLVRQAAPSCSRLLHTRQVAASSRRQSVKCTEKYSEALISSNYCFEIGLLCDRILRSSITESNRLMLLTKESLFIIRNTQITVWGSPRPTRNTLPLHYREHPVNAVWGNSRCLLWEPYGKHRYTVWAEFIVLACQSRWYV